MDVDSNQRLAIQFRAGIPAVKAFANGKVAGEFTGALSRSHRFANLLKDFVPQPLIYTPSRVLSGR
ncbi:MAG: hypothetical protein U0401_19040 [Anaerolineae bacterium]